MLEEIPQLSTGTDNVKELHFIKVENLYDDVNKSIYSNFYKCLDTPEGNNLYNNYEAELKTTQEDAVEHPSLKTIVNKKISKNKNNIEDEDTWNRSSSETFSEDSTTHSQSEGHKHRILKKKNQKTKEPKRRTHTITKN